MRKLPFVILTIIFLMAFFFINPWKKLLEENKEESLLWPEIEPFKEEYLKVSDLHNLFYELSGNPEGKPVFVLHGGPGASCSPDMRRFFNPKTFLIVMHDQRGAGKSRPFAELENNTTQYLVEDIERLRTHLKLGKIFLFGGSWGSTLALAYGETYPDNISGMVLRGIFTATKDEIDHFYNGGVRPFFPKMYDELLAPLQGSGKISLPDTLFQLIKSEDAFVRERYAKIWARYEFVIGELVSDPQWIEGFFSSENVMDYIYAFSLIENYYMKNGCFLKEGQLLNDAHRLKDIPIILVNGRYDMICPPVNAYRLHQLLPKSELVIAEGAGHWMGDKPVEKALIEAVKSFK